MTDPKRKKLAASNEPVRASPKAAKPTLKLKKDARSAWLLDVAKEAHAKGGTWFTLGCLTYRAERARHPHEGKALVQVAGNTVELVEITPQKVQDTAGTEVLVYWARRRGSVQKVLVHVPYVLAIVTAEHAAGGTATGLSKVPEVPVPERSDP